MTDLQVAAIGFLLVTGTGLLIASRALHRISLAHTIRTRYLASRKVRGLYLERDECGIL